MGVGFGGICGDDGGVCETGFAGHRFGFRHVYPHAGDYCSVGCVFLTYAKKWQPVGSLSGRNWLFLILSGLATGASWLAYFKALQLGNASQVAPIDKLSVVLVAVFAVLFLGERPNAQTWLGIGLVVGGVLVLAVKR